MPRDDCTRIVDVSTSIVFEISMSLNRGQQDFQFQLKFTIIMMIIAMSLK